MKDNKEKEIWVNDVMDSIKGMQRIPADPLMYDKVLSRINNDKRNRDKIRTLLPRIAAAAVLLLIINIASILHASSTARSAQQTQHAGVYELVSEGMSNVSEDSF